MEPTTEKKMFLSTAECNSEATKLVVVVKLPTGATELIINTEQIASKVGYYDNTYDDDMKLKANPSIQIVGWLFA